MNNKGFTLIELLVVVAIIGILSTVVLASLGQARTRARNVSTYTALNQMKTTIVGAQVATNQTVFEMTGASGAGTYSSCPTATDLSLLTSTHACRVNWETAIDAISSDYGSAPNEGFYEDAWGSPFLLNEGENPPTCTYDTLSSAGPDKILATADDLEIAIPYESCSN